ncbi:MAG: helix-turn-helix domain-containing protein [Rhodoglobus sp.]
MKGIARRPQDLGEIVRTIRLAHKISQDDLAAQLGVTQRYLSELERGKPKILDDRYFTVLSRLGITIMYTTND